MCRGIMGERSINSAKAALHKAKDVDNKTWLCVAYGVLAEALELEENLSQAKMCRKEAGKYFAHLPVCLGLIEVGVDDVERM